MVGPHPGDIWAFGASGDRPLYGLVGVTSRDGEWLSAIGCSHAKNVGQGWHDCIHHVPKMQMYLDDRNARIVHRTMLYVMSNDKRRLLEHFRRDFPDADETSLEVSAGKSGALRVRPRLRNAPAVDLALAVPGAGWEASEWGGFIRSGPGWRMWANPVVSSVDLAVSFENGRAPAKVEAELSRSGWIADRALSSEPVLARRSADGVWHAEWIWNEATRAGRRPAYRLRVKNSL